MRGEIIGTVSPDGTSVTVDPGVGVDSFKLSRPAPAGKVVRFKIKQASTNSLSTGESTAVVSAVLGSSHDSHAAMARFLDRYRIPYARPRSAEEQASAKAKTTALGSRRDLRQQLVITIDDDSSKDLDDALAAELSSDGSIRLWVHIADVAEYVTPGSPLDLAAAQVPTSVYLPQGVRHMLPDALAADTLSLIPSRDRDTLCVEMRLDTDGLVRGVDIYEARIRSRQRVSYRTVAQVIDGKQTDLPPEVLSLLRVLRTAGSRLSIQRAVRGGLDAMRVDQPYSTTGSTDKAHQLIERLMVATNEAVATWLRDRGVPALWRVHDPISEEQAEELERVASGFGVVAGLGSPVSALALAAATSQVPAGPAGAAFWDALLGVLGRARYSVEPGKHFGLGSPGYLHFTSPLRRYPDLLVHRAVKGYLAGQRDVAGLTAELAAHAEHANVVFRQAAQAERDAKLAIELNNLAPGEVVRATVSGRTRSGVRVRLEDYDVFGVLSASLRPGDRVTLRVVRVDPIAGRLELAAVRPAKETQPAKQGGRRKTRPRRM
jgi:ribonuclease R